jgi:hypothetical protein
MHQSVLSSTLMLYNLESWHIHTYIHKRTHVTNVFYITATIKVCMLFFRTSLPTVFISSPIVSLFFFCTEMETNNLVKFYN